MNVLIVLGVVAFAVTVLWTVQSAALKLVGEPLAWPLRFTTRKPLVRWTSRVMVQASFLIVLVGTPLALGIRPLDALSQAFPRPVPWREIAIAFSIFFFPSLVLYVVWMRVGWVRFEPQFEPTRRRWKLFRRFLTPLPLATIEEAAFRGVLLEQLLRSFPHSLASTTAAIILSSAAFSSVHFIKPTYPGQPVWQAAYGFFIVGCLFGLAYVVGGRTLWLPITMHATAIFVVQVMLLYMVHKGPPWLVGHSEWPQSGLIGSMLILCMGILLIVLI
jgi:hypothetical protein